MAPGARIQNLDSHRRAERAGAGVDIHTSGEATLLELAENNGIEIVNQCRMGFCGKCKARCVSGSIEMSEETGMEQLTDEEREANYVLTCVGCPTSDVKLEV